MRWYIGCTCRSCLDIRKALSIFYSWWETSINERRVMADERGWGCTFLVLAGQCAGLVFHCAIDTLLVAPG